MLDALKGYVAVAPAFSRASIIRTSCQPCGAYTIYLLAALAGFCALLGHMFPVWLRFKGGKGVATALGAFLALAPTAVVVSLVVFLAAVAITRYVSLGSILAASRFPFAAWWLNPFDRTTVDLCSHRRQFPADHRSSQRQHPPPAGRHRKPFSLKKVRFRVSKIAVIGAGAWGTAIAIVLGRREGPRSSLCGRTKPEVRDSINARHVNEFFLSGHAHSRRR